VLVLVSVFVLVLVSVLHRMGLEGGMEHKHRDRTVHTV